MYDISLKRKLIISGNLAELVTYQVPNFDVAKVVTGDAVFSPVLEKNFSAAYRARRQFRRLAYANSYRHFDSNNYVIHPRFVTFTYGSNIQNISISNRYFSKFIMRVDDSDFLPQKIQYQAVLEFQNRGAAHYHVMVFNQPFLFGVKDFFRSTWRPPEAGGGFIRYKTFASVSGSVNYCSKYFSKSFGDSRLRYKKRYFRSRGLKMPVVVDDDVQIQLWTNSFQEKYQTLDYHGIGFDLQEWVLSTGYGYLPTAK